VGDPRFEHALTGKASVSYTDHTIDSRTRDGTIVLAQEKLPSGALERTRGGGRR
jgi:hypothetical protein